MTIEDYINTVQSQKQRLEKVIDFEFQSPLWELFSLAELIGPKEIKNVYEKLFEAKKDDVGFLTELAIVLNHKIFQWYKVDDTIGLTYDELWKKTDVYAIKTLEGDELQYYILTTD